MSETSELFARLAEIPIRDERRLRRRLDGLRKLRDPATRQGTLESISRDVDAAAQRAAARRESVPPITYPEQLPVSQRKDEIADAIRDHQVVIVAGETGSGKTTQIPKICLELGRGIRGLIGHTQPRRIAARTVADRVAEELGTPLGSTVGYQVRFTDRTNERTLVKLMTDGILLTELQHDRALAKYDTLIIDEAHERSLNIDFILGYLKQLLPRRPDLKVIITSATIETARFSAHFDDAPVIEVSGRTFPVEMRYRPLMEAVDDETDEPRDQIQAISDAVDELSTEGPGDILVFLSGEREIRDTADFLRKRQLRNTEILPLYARLSVAEQHRVFQPHPGRRIVLATNVAETSLTVPGIRYVIDPGTARISRYSHRTKVQRLPIEPISQASANQRAGRCGRVAAGICIRLYDEQDFAARPEFTDPEILRTNLASVILQMTAIGLGDIAAFPFIDPPDRRNITAGIQLLEELGALDADRRLTPMGRRVSALPIDPRLARMVLEADRNGCVREVLIIAAALSIQDPRERPSDRQQAADEKHARFADPSSDFMAYLKLWDYVLQQQEDRSSSGFRRMCRTEFLNYLRVREWQDLHGQLRQVMKSLEITPNPEPCEDPQRIHTSLLSGLLSHIGLKESEKHEYAGARGTKFAVFPGSALFKKPPRWVMAAELVETSRLWARIAARIEPEWVEPLAQHLVKRQYSEPHWSAKQGATLGYEKVTLYGVPIVAKRQVNFGRIDPPLARELFIRHALVQGEWQTHHRFWQANQDLLAELAELEHKARRRDIVVDDEVVFDFYDKRVPPDVVSVRHFDTWWKQARRDTPDLLTFDRDLLLNAVPGTGPESFPDVWRLPSGLELPLVYRFEPGAPDDGVTVEIPLAVLGQVPSTPFEWQVPGFREELITALIRGLPKAVRRYFVPVPDTVAEVLATMPFEPEEPLLESLERTLRRLTGEMVAREQWDLARLPGHLTVNFRVLDEEGKVRGEGRDLTALRAALRGEVRAAVAAAGAELEQRGLKEWPSSGLPRTVTRHLAGFDVTAYPALVDEGDSVAVKLFETQAEQTAAMWSGTRRLLLLGTNSPVRTVVGQLSNHAKLALGRNPHKSVPDLLEDCVAAALDKLMADAGGPAWDAEGFAVLAARVRAELVASTVDTVRKVVPILGHAYTVEQRLAALRDPVSATAVADVRSQLKGLVYRGFVTATGWWRLPEIPRYLRAVEKRLERLPSGAARDRELMAEVRKVQQEYDDLRKQVPMSAELIQIRWMIEELRVNLFAQTIGTPYPISTTRIYRALDQLG
ncbi:ATP-dependent helicase [Virgisporangium aliadipatigenens]|uniref:RNA helicase n=1 Tax=Virgisporangium aliadipatigenens TaxID=741659 RepID=A0A8J4DRC7_9ACTN|nr:ATP-dependent RNA helicase HrpA [Virgisporangium aliadipatigenens]GIJ46931.1 ATP-dependent helicase [Virgisporangium aliadipatigenens]